MNYKSLCSRPKQCLWEDSVPCDLRKNILRIVEQNAENSPSYPSDLSQHKYYSQPSWHEACCHGRAGCSNTKCWYGLLLAATMLVSYPLTSFLGIHIHQLRLQVFFKQRITSQTCLLPGQACYVGPWILLRTISFDWRKCSVFIPATNSYQHVSNSSQVEIYTALSHGGNLSKRTTYWYLLVSKLTEVYSCLRIE